MIGDKVKRKILNINFKYFAIGILALITFTHCDTEDNVEPRFNDFFVKIYGGQGDQIGVDLKSTTDGGFILIGFSDPDPSDQSVGDKDIFIVRTDSIGNEIWSGFYGGSFDDEGVAIQHSQDGNYIFVANYSIGFENNILVMKIDDSGNVLDSAIFGNPSEVDRASSISIINNGFIIAGTTTDVTQQGKPAGTDPALDIEDILSYKIDIDLNEDPVWTNVFGFPEIDNGSAVLQKSGGGFAFFGTTNKEAPNDSQKELKTFFSFPSNNEGIPSGDISQFGTLNDEIVADVAVTSVNSFVMIGTTTDGASSDLFMVQLKADLAFEDQGSINSTFDVEGKAIIEAIGGEFIVVGESIFDDDTRDVYLAKVTKRREIIWETNFGGDDTDRAGSVLQLSDGSIVLVASLELDTQLKMALIKTDGQGNLKP